MEVITYIALFVLFIVSLALLARLRGERSRADGLAKQLTSMEGVLAEEQTVGSTGRRRSEMLHRLVDGIEDGLFIVGSDMRVMFVNRGAQGYFPPVDEPVGRPLLECMRDQRLVEMIGKCSREGRRLREEFLVAANSYNGVTADRVYSVEAVPLQEEGATLVILRDETAKHDLERIRKDFVANASHELRTPLSIINGYLENLSDGAITDADETKRAFTVMKKHGDRLAHLVEDLLVISRMESGEHESLQMEAFDFEQCAKDVVHRLSPLITAKQAKVRIVIKPKDERELYGDQFYWDQILFNLVQNALKENPASGLNVDILLTQTVEHSEVIVKDNGVGIPQADMPFVFKRFYRVLRSRPTDVKGTGLGLSIVKRAVEAHKGTITLRSKPGIETAFTILVPRVI